VAAGTGRSCDDDDDNDDDDDDDGDDDDDDNDDDGDDNHNDDDVSTSELRESVGRPSLEVINPLAALTDRGGGYGSIL
jgi:hypothetical protein